MCWTADLDLWDPVTRRNYSAPEDNPGFYGIATRNIRDKKDCIASEKQFADASGIEPVEFGTNSLPTDLHMGNLAALDNRSQGPTTYSKITKKENGVAW